MDPKPLPIKKPQKLKLHSCGFLQYELNPIISLAYSPLSNMLLVAREAINTIEIYKYPSFCLLFSFNLGASDLISKVIFHRNENILAICQNGMIYDFNLHSFTPSQSMLIPGGALNDIVYHPLKQEYLIASDDGTLKIYESKEGSGRLGFLRAARSFGAKALACVWDDLDNNAFYGSYQNGLIRKFDRLLNVSLVINLSPKVFAWKLLSLSGSLVAGCSNGNVGFYESKYGTLLKSINFHQADVLCLCANSKGNAIYASGSDSRIVSIQNLKEAEEEGSDWVVTSQERGQSHDVYALTIINDELLISGGITTDMCLYKLEGSRFIERMFAQKEKNEENKVQSEELERKITIKLRHIVGLQSRNIIQTSDSSRKRILFQKTFTLEIWELITEKKEFRFLIEVRNKENAILAASLSPCGSFLAYSSLNGLSLFQIVGTKLEKITEIEEVVVSALRFSADSKVLYYVTAKSEFYHFDLKSGTSNFVSSLKNEIFDQIEISPLEDYVALGSKLGNLILVFRDRELYYEIPEIMNLGFTAFTFSPHEEKLFVVYENNKFAGFDLKNTCLDKWSSQNISKFPNNYLNKTNQIVGVVPHPEDRNKLILYSNFYYVLVNLEEKVPKMSRVVHWEEKVKAKRPSNFDIITRKFPILSVANFNENELILFQNSWNQMLKNMPGAINTKRFGN